MSTLFEKLRTYDVLTQNASARLRHVKVSMRKNQAAKWQAHAECLLELTRAYADRGKANRNQNSSAKKIRFKKQKRPQKISQETECALRTICLRKLTPKAYAS